MQAMLTSRNGNARWQVMRRLAIVVLLFSGHSIAATAQAAGEYSALYVFGDSLSDPGNAYVLIGQSAVPPFEPVPSAPYEIGDFHFSNGRTWIEYLAPRLNLRRGSLPAFERPRRFGNYAIGGSRLRPGTSPLQTFAGQVGIFFFNLRGTAPGDALYAVEFGGNDIRDAIEAAFTDPTLATSFTILDEAVAAEAAGVSDLYAAGARHFLVMNAPNLALVPESTTAGPDRVAAALLMSATFNTDLAEAMEDLEATLPGIDIRVFDTFALLSDITANPSIFGFDNVVDPCLTFFVTVDVFCDNPNRYLFWDFIHPTTAAHRVVARQVLYFLSQP